MRIGLALLERAGAAVTPTPLSKSIPLSPQMSTDLFEGGGNGLTTQRVTTGESRTVHASELEAVFIYERFSYDQHSKGWVRGLCGCTGYPNHCSMPMHTERHIRVTLTPMHTERRSQNHKMTYQGVYSITWPMRGYLEWENSETRLIR